MVKRNEPMVDVLRFLPHFRLFNLITIPLTLAIAAQ